MTDRRRCRHGRNFTVRSCSSKQLRRLAEQPGEPPPASAALGHSLEDLQGEEWPPSGQEEPAASAFLPAPQGLCLQPRVSCAPDPRSGFWRQLARGASCTLTARDPPLPSRELQLLLGSPGSCSRAAAAAAARSGGPSSPQVLSLCGEGPHC